MNEGDLFIRVKAKTETSPKGIVEKDGLLYEAKSRRLSAATRRALQTMTKKKSFWQEPTRRKRCRFNVDVVAIKFSSTTLIDSSIYRSATQ